MELFKSIKTFFIKKCNKKFKTSFPEFKVNVPLPEIKPLSLQDKVKEQTKNITTYQLVQELNRRKNEKHDGYEINYVIGKVTGDIHVGNQSDSKDSICHACGLDRKCLNKDCPNTKIDNINKWMFPEIE